ncbi:T-lymphocyte surface antigen Ly-9-like isoform X3 [Hypanus sabinus]|uniref:T-lymphocyte surface antigen Ly-9-like isoform X3 n=1 Tax=Hypanus sabinus TaxID=79690 RepID=UPI0028C475E4|nr:T-lymphocyte surface antigen Ly-9-like isoform X3 [Hypanus sabinus]
MVWSLLCVAVWIACVAGTGASPTTVNGAQGGWVSLPAKIPAGPDIAEVVWRLLSPRKKLVTYSNKNIEYYGPEEYKRRITFHPGDFSLEIRDLQKQDAGDYELTVTARSGEQTQRAKRLQVDDPVGTVKGAWGQRVSLPAGITSGLDISHLVWRSVGTRITEYANSTIFYFGPEEYKRRITLHPENFSLEISDLRREDAKDYEVTVTASSGAQTQKGMRLEVFDWAKTVKGTWGMKVFLPVGFTPWQGVSQVVWRSNKTRIAESVSGNISYFGPEEYKRRITLHPENFSLEICDLRRQDAGEYEVETAVVSGANYKAKLQLEVDDPNDKPSHTVLIIAVVVILILILLCCGVLYRKRDDLRSHWDKCMGKKSGTSDEPAVTHSLNS